MNNRGSLNNKVNKVVSFFYIKNSQAWIKQNEHGNPIFLRNHVPLIFLAPPLSLKSQRISAGLFARIWLHRYT